MQLSKFVALYGHVLERLHEVLAMADGASLILVGGQARIRLVRSNHRLVLLRLCAIVMGLRLTEASDALMLRRSLCGCDQGTHRAWLLAFELIREGAETTCVSVLRSVN